MSKIKDLFLSLRLWQKLLLVAVLIGLVGGVFLLSRPGEYEILYSNLAKEDAGSMKKVLADSNIQYQMEKGDEIIKVHPEDVPKAIAALSEKGLPSDASVGYELFNQGNMLTSNFQQQIQYKYTTINEIQKKLVKSFPDFIQKAYVTADMDTEEKLWQEKDEKTASASVTVETKGGKALNEDQVKAIQTMVAGHIINLDVKDVKVLDASGRVYDGEEDASMSGGKGFSKQSVATHETEKRILSELHKTLAKNFGEGNFTLNVKVRIDFDEVVRNIEKYDPQGTLVSKTQREENTDKNGAGSTTEVGTQANGTVPEYQQVNGGGNQDQFKQSKKELIENYEISKIVETIKKNPQITNVKVTATVNKPMRRVDQEGFVRDWQQILANAADIDVDEAGNFKNGNVVVSVQNFEKNNPVEVDTGEKAPKETNNAFKYAAWAVGSFLTLFVLFLFLRPKRKEPVVEELKNDFESKSDNFPPTNPTMDIGQQEAVEDKVKSEIYANPPKNFEEEVNQLAVGNPKRTADFIKLKIKEH
ncbi:flagellar M-ring protein FliF C-terminal domain-containing protein [Bacillus luti]|nr:flagellar M-ring protein FliF [Bacillus cereus]